jgi:hypothetical protein
MPSNLDWPRLLLSYYLRYKASVGFTKGDALVYEFFSKQRASHPVTDFL